MRHTTTQLNDIFQPITQHIHDALHAGCHAAKNSTLSRITDPDKSALFSHIVRAEAYEYLHHNPIDGFTLDHQRHRHNQSITLHHTTGLETRLLRLTNFTHTTQQPLPGIDLPPLPIPHFTHDIIAISWETPTFDGDTPNEIPLTLIRPAIGTTLRDGRADTIIKLKGYSTLIPATSFDPNEADTYFTFEEDLTYGL